VNRVEHRIHVLHDFRVVEAQHMEALALEVSCAPIVICDSLVGCVLPAIDLNDESSAETAKIGDVRTDGNLSPKMGIAQRQSIPQMPP
jgi:hypothetical protein